MWDFPRQFLKDFESLFYPFQSPKWHFTEAHKGEYVNSKNYSCAYTWCLHLRSCTQTFCCPLPKQSPSTEYSISSQGELRLWSGPIQMFWTKELSLQEKTELLKFLDVISCSRNVATVPRELQNSLVFLERGKQTSETVYLCWGSKISTDIKCYWSRIEKADHMEKWS